MKNKLLLAILIALSGIHASAQSVYTGYVKFKKSGYSLVVDNAKTEKEKREGEKFIRNLILQVYGNDALTNGLGTDIEEHVIVVGRSKDAIESMNAYYKDQLKGKSIENISIAIYSILKIKGAVSSEAGGYSLIDLKNKKAYDLYDERIINLTI
ncbi:MULTISPECIES: hypothetical protein [unclassified Pedobacter]|uniref:hypothetical protein n=1 Tax=unclassified Pedobacter TaxID=2628915 RepID=UPI001423857C|nr:MULTISPECIES: hypothetical protein [unclassified Pedobacter]NII82630.1 uncharacterized protein YjhX (UPF0386 family) [Pedobacter sp. SG908]NMN36650.1 uncharacterized protein YjhX (UPF0386 family) [Pedobacter sp. SG918]